MRPTRETKEPVFTVSLWKGKILGYRWKDRDLSGPLWEDTTASDPELRHAHLQGAALCALPVMLTEDVWIPRWVPWNMNPPWALTHPSPASFPAVSVS